MSANPLDLILNISLRRPEAAHLVSNAKDRDRFERELREAADVAATNLASDRPAPATAARSASGDRDSAPLRRGPTDDAEKPAAAAQREPADRPAESDDRADEHADEPISSDSTVEHSESSQDDGEVVETSDLLTSASAIDTVEESADKDAAVEEKQDGFTNESQQESHSEVKGGDVAPVKSAGLPGTQAGEIAAIDAQLAGQSIASPSTGGDPSGDDSRHADYVAEEELLTEVLADKTPTEEADPTDLAIEPEIQPEEDASAHKRRQQEASHDVTQAAKGHQGDPEQSSSKRESPARDGFAPPNQGLVKQSGEGESSTLADATASLLDPATEGGPETRVEQLPPGGTTSSAVNATSDGMLDAVIRFTGRAGSNSSGGISHLEQGAPRVSSARFVGRIATAFRLAQERGGVLQLRLSPPELGALRLEVSLQQGVLTATIEAETLTARNLLLDNLPILRERLAEQNIRVEKFDVDVQRDLGQGGQRSDPGGEREERQSSTPRPLPMEKADESLLPVAEVASITGENNINLLI